MVPKKNGSRTQIFNEQIMMQIYWTHMTGIINLTQKKTRKDLLLAERYLLSIQASAKFDFQPHAAQCPLVTSQRFLYPSGVAPYTSYVLE
ncbi:MAG: hypothetical protein A2061_02400 [Gallionellales bacterium GWA2_59_43]|nr:MAG: hypothetical protein A2061_02400 [Gallionellales bacterium GWA2_59_43]